jgi:hypothetical protein
MGSGGGGGSSTFAGLSDVSFTNLTDDDFAQYDATAQKWKNVAITGVSVQPVIYSTEEREVGVWTDSKPLYQKTYTALLSGNSALIDISSLGAENAWAVDGYYDIGVTRLGLNEWITSDAYTKTHVNPGSAYLNIDCTCSVSPNATVVITIQYTKTTDAPGSGTWTPQGVPAVHYSTDEQVVGTWIDGSTVYEKTITISGVVSGITQISMSGIKDFISYSGYIKDNWNPASLLPIPRVASDGNNVGIGNVYADYFTLIVPSAFGSRLYDPIITIRYTKSST